MKRLSLFIFIDALGYEIYQNHPDFLLDITKESRKLKTVFGYSSACDPSIISGKLPEEHKMWSSFYYNPKTCPYKWVKHLRWLPTPITDYHRVRSKLSDLIASVHGFTGYFQIYNVPFRYLPYFDYMEKQWIWGTKETLASGTTIFDKLINKEVPFYVKNSQHVSDQLQWKQATEAIGTGSISFAYLMLGKLDADMHAHGTKHPVVQETLEQYDSMIRNLIDKSAKNYDEVAWYVFSDHGMHDVSGGFDLEKEISSLHLTFGQDYVALYDSTMARFWFLEPEAKQKIHDKLHTLDVGRILSNDELKSFGTYFSDHLYGETIFLMNSPMLIAPSFMGKKVIPGMHGFHPDDAESAAMICSNQSLPKELEQIHQIYGLMSSACSTL